MAKFDTDDYDFPNDDGYYNPEDRFDIHKINKQKKSIISLFDNIGSLSGNQIIYIIFAIIWLLLLLNLKVVLDAMFYFTLYILQYIIIIFVFIAIGYFIWKRL